MDLKKFVISRRDIMIYLLTILIAYCILFPADKLNIKEILLFVTLFFGYFDNKILISKKLIFFGLLFPMFEIAYALIRNIELGDAISFGYVWIFLLLIPIIKKYRFDFKKVFIVATYAVGLIINFIMITDLFGIMPFENNFVANYFYNMNEIQGLGKGVAATIGYSIFYKSCPLILVSYAYFIYKKKYIAAMPLLLALLASGTRANFLAALFLTAIVPIISFDDVKKRKTALIIIGLASICLLPIAYNKMVNLNAIKKAGSDNVKISDTYRAINELNDNPINWLLGTGVGSSFVSVRGNDMSTYEISIVDHVRQTGLVGGVVLITFIVLIIKKVIQNKNKWLLVILFGYLAVACTNPLLVTSTSFMLYLFIICYNDSLNNEVIVEDCGVYK